MSRVERAIRCAAAMLLLAGCGSTVAGQAVSVTGDGLALGTGGAGANASAGTPAADDSQGVSARAAGTPAGAGTSFDASRAAGPVGSTGGGGPTSPRTADGPGVTPTTITIGISYYQNGAAANAALGAKGVDTGDPVAATRVLIDAINKSGGIAGRRIVPLLYAIDPQSSTPYAAEAQAECTYFTQDHKILFLIDGAPAADARACLAKAGVAVLRGGIVSSALSSNELDAYTSLSSRAFAAMVPTLMRDGWFNPWNRVTASPGTTRAKVGIVTPDSIDANRAVDQVLIPALRAAGYPPASADVIRIASPGGFTDDGATVAAIDNASLKLNADGVDHVILNDGNGSLSLLFNNYAYSQGYFPRYGGTSGNAWQVLLGAGDIQAKTLNGAIGIGWQPLFDTPYSSSTEGPHPNAARHRCFELFKRAGQGRTDAASSGGQAGVCDIALLVPTALRGYRGPINLAVLLQRVAALGSTYQVASAFSSSFASDKRDGNGAFLSMHFDGDCGCIAYSGSIQPMPR